MSLGDLIFGIVVITISSFSLGLSVGNLIFNKDK